MTRIELLPVDDVLRTSDETVVRRRFDARNRVSLLILACASFFLSIIMATSNLGDNRPFDVYLASANFVLIVGLLFLLRDMFRAGRPDRKPGLWQAGNWLLDHITAASVTFLIVQYTFCVTYSHKEGWIGWVMIFPFIVIAFRLPVAEAVLVHVYFLAVAILMGFLFITRVNARWPTIIASLIMNAIALGVVLYASRGLRREVIGDWTERRQYAREQVRMRDELQYARELQLAMLPEHAPQLDWLDVAGVSIPATEVGGDYYDYFVEGNRVAMVCGDVAGHGLASGLVLASLRSGFTLLRGSLSDPAFVLQRLHDLVAQTSRRRMLATAAVVLIDRDTRRATIASAGHPPVLVRRNGTIESIELYAPPLGVRLPVEIPQMQLDVSPGDVFVLHSDGVYESRNELDEVYGLDRLASLVRSHADGSAEELRDAIVAEVEAFRGATPQGDDVTVVIARVL